MSRRRRCHRHFQPSQARQRFLCRRLWGRVAGNHS